MSDDRPNDLPAGPIDREPFPEQFRTDREAALRDVLAVAGVELGAYDDRIVRWAGEMMDWGTIATIASWVKRAAQETDK